MILDFLADEGKAWGVLRGRGAQVDAVTTVVAVDEEGCHVRLSSGGVLDLTHSRPLPRVLNCVCKYDVVACDVESSKSLNVEVDSWFSNLISED